jgi:diacylglycerol kinase (ATP)
MKPTHYSRIALIQNPGAGAHDSEPRKRVRERLEGICESLTEITVQPGLDIADRTLEIVREGADLVVVAAGDSTVHEAASSLVGTEKPLAIVPLGTFNNLALSLDLPRDADAACNLIEAGYTREIDVGLADKHHYFFEAAGVGVDAELFPIGEDVKSGRFQSIVRAIRLAIHYRQVSIVMEFDRPVSEAYHRSFLGQSPMKKRRRRFRGSRKRIKLRCSFVAIGNGPYYGSNFNVCPGAILDDGRFSIGVYRDFSKLELLRHFWSISGGRRLYNPKMEMFEAKTLQVSSPGRLNVHVDGRPIGTTPVRFRILPKALKVVVPESLRSQSARMSSAAPHVSS